MKFDKLKIVKIVAVGVLGAGTAIVSEITKRRELEEAVKQAIEIAKAQA